MTTLPFSPAQLNAQAPQSGAAPAFQNPEVMDVTQPYQDQARGLANVADLISASAVGGAKLYKNYVDNVNNTRFNDFQDQLRDKSLESRRNFKTALKTMPTQDLSPKNIDGTIGKYLVGDDVGKDYDDAPDLKEQVKKLQRAQNDKDKVAMLQVASDHLQKKGLATLLRKETQRKQEYQKAFIKFHDDPTQLTLVRNHLDDTYRHTLQGDVANGVIPEYEAQDRFAAMQRDALYSQFKNDYNLAIASNDPKRVKKVWESYKNGKYSWSGKGWNNKEKVRVHLDANRVGHDLSVLLNRVAGGDRQILKDTGYARLQAETRDNPASIPARFFDKDEKGVYRLNAKGKAYSEKHGLSKSDMQGFLTQSLANIKKDQKEGRKELKEEDYYNVMMGHAAFKVQSMLSSDTTGLRSSIEDYKIEGDAAIDVAKIDMFAETASNLRADLNANEISYSTLQKRKQELIDDAGDNAYLQYIANKTIESVRQKESILEKNPRHTAVVAAMGQETADNILKPLDWGPVTEQNAKFDLPSDSPLLENDSAFFHNLFDRKNLSQLGNKATEVFTPTTATGEPNPAYWKNILYNRYGEKAKQAEAQLMQELADSGEHGGMIAALMNLSQNGMKDQPIALAVQAIITDKDSLKGLDKHHGDIALYDTQRVTHLDTLFDPGQKGDLRNLWARVATTYGASDQQFFNLKKAEQALFGHWRHGVSDKGVLVSMPFNKMSSYFSHNDDVAEDLTHSHYAALNRLTPDDIVIDQFNERDPKLSREEKALLLNGNAVGISLQYLTDLNGEGMILTLYSTHMNQPVGIVRHASGYKEGMPIQHTWDEWLDTNVIAMRGAQYLDDIENEEEMMWQDDQSHEIFDWAYSKSIEMEEGYENLDGKRFYSGFFPSLYQTWGDPGKLEHRIISDWLQQAYIESGDEEPTNKQMLEALYKRIEFYGGTEFGSTLNKIGQWFNKQFGDRLEVTPEGNKELKRRSPPKGVEGFMHQMNPWSPWLY